MKNVAANLALSVASLIVTLLLLEGLLRFLPVNEGLRAQAVNVRQPIYHFEPNRVAQYSHRWDFDIQNVVHVNNYGFVSDKNYNPKAISPLLAIVGDSYVEAQMVPFSKSIAGRLQERLQDRGRVYAFAASGAGLAQHLIYAKYARDKFKPDAFAFVIIANDFVESLASRNASNGFHTFARDGSTGWKMKLKDYEPSFVRRLLRESKLAMYLLTNVKAHVQLRLSVGNAHLPFGLGAKDKGKRFVGNVEFHADKSFWNDAKWATSIYLKNLPKWAGVSPDRIVFIVDGIRPEVYDKQAQLRVSESFWARMREHFSSEAGRLGYEVIDLQPRFTSRYMEDKKRFEFSTDAHWNSEGHSVAADGVAGSKVWQSVFSPLPSDADRSTLGIVTGSP